MPRLYTLGIYEFNLDSLKVISKDLNTIRIYIDVGINFLVTYESKEETDLQYKRLRYAWEKE